MPAWPVYGELRGQRRERWGVSVPLFLAEREHLLSGDRVHLSGAEGKHASAARRLTAGERVDLTDGAGLLAECVVTSAGRDGLEAEVRSRSEHPAPTPRLVVVQALPKGDRGERAVEMLTEAGVDVVVPWAASRCITRWEGSRGDKALARWQVKAREAAKQSRRVFLPEVAPLATTKAVAQTLSAAALGAVLDSAAETRLAELWPPHQAEQAGPRTTEDVKASGDIMVVVGPEGGVAPEELAAFESAGAVAARLGPTVLRTSTAGVAAVAVLAARCGRW